MALILLPRAQVELFAQQGYWQGSSPYGPYAQPSRYSPSTPYYRGYGSSSQSAYPYPDSGYAQSQPSPQTYQQSSPNSYAQEPYGTPPYAELDRNDSEPPLGPSQPAAQQAFTAEQLEQILAPIALYPDGLLAQMLAAATYPAQISVANQWLRSMGNAPPEQIAAGADAQNWDPSVKALTAFPQVLALMDHDLAWTTDLGNAYYNQTQDVLQTVQVLRQRAQAAGTLQNTPQERITYDQGNIELAPPDPQEVYVPSYNPWNAYGDPVQPYPGFSLLGSLESFFGSSPIQWGMGIAMAAFNHTPFGWLSWAMDWLGNSVLFNHSSYYSQSTSVAHWGYGRGSGYGYGSRAWAGGSWNGGYGRTNGYYGHDRFGDSRSDFYRRDYGRGGYDWNRDRNYGSNYGIRPGYESRPGYGSSYLRSRKRLWKLCAACPPPAVRL